MTTPRRKQGATLALVISLVFVFLLVGACFFIWQLLVGGGKELQHATDSGNLNVAKQALKTPSYLVPDAINPITNTNLRLEFKDVLVDDNGNPDFNVNLLNFNRLVGKAVLAQLNAKAEGTDAAKTNAQQITQAVYSIGQQLQSQISQASSLKGHFEGMSNQNSVRMLDHPDGNVGPSIAHTDAEYAISYLARGKASNVYIEEGQYPLGGLSSNDTVEKDVGGTKKFLVGYQSISTAAGLGCPVTWAVPLRPGEQPHLVSIDDFDRNTTPPSPLPNNALPNAFKSGGQAAFIRTGTNVALRSCAVVGVLSKTYPVMSSGGVLVIDNMGNNYPVPYDSNNVSIPDGGSSIFAGPLMAPKGIELFRITANNGTFPDGSKTRDYMCYHPGSGQLPSEQIAGHHNSTQDAATVTPQAPADGVRKFPSNNLTDGVDTWAMTMDGQPRYVSQYAERNQIMGTAGMGAPGTTVGGAATTISSIGLCNNHSFDSGSGGPSQCTDPNNVSSVFPSFLNGDIGVSSGNSGSTTYSGLMPLEQYILNVHGGFGAGAGCVNVPGLGPVGGCAASGRGSGMKHITSSLPPWQEGTLDQLLDDTNTFPSVREDIQRRLRQIAPKANPQDIFNAVVPYNKLMFVSSTNSNGTAFSVTYYPDSGQPATLQYNYVGQLGSFNRPQKVNNIPDGDPVNSNNDIRVSGRWIPGSYWECGSGMASGTSASVSKWYPSSGKGGLMGVLRFNNCPEAGGPDWCCP